MLWSAVFIAAYAATYLFIFGGSTAEEVSAQSGGYPTVFLILTPVLAFGSLINGARE